MDILPLLLILLSAIILECLDVVCCNTTWEHLSLRYGLWYKPPRTPSEALQQGYTRVNDICKMDTYHGFMYVQEGNDKSRVIFDLNGNLAGMQTMIPGNLKGFNSKNETIRLPPIGIIPPILLDVERGPKGMQMYTITAYFKHPKLICSPYAPNVSPGRGFFLQTGYNVEEHYEQIPLSARHLSPDWVAHTCNPKMGLHYFKKLTPNMKCEDMYPVFLMYNSEGQLGAFGWSFQGAPSPFLEDDLTWFRISPQYYPFVFDTSQLPSCMYNKNFQVFGIHVWLRDPDTMLCPVVKVPMRDREYRTTTRSMTTTTERKIDSNIIVDKIIRDSFSSGHSNNSLIHLILFNSLIGLLFCSTSVQMTIVCFCVSLINSFL
ncbi:uncharacterized protein LOC126823289 [Patella vulgata]|uniref:uncharacterized protein LOC126823289 n=1 Tax=Patella vulgata TaxID=6465 RepID=UPI00217F8BF7|nr:uncharacterized protein LOC126823289 [Patella vulgata]